MFFHRKDPFRNEALIGYTETPALGKRKSPAVRPGLLRFMPISQQNTQAA
jgi:hypothetical protein